MMRSTANMLSLQLRAALRNAASRARITPRAMLGAGVSSAGELNPGAPPRRFEVDLSLSALHNGHSDAHGMDIYACAVRNRACPPDRRHLLGSTGMDA